MRVGMISFAHLHAHAYAQALKNHPAVTLVGIHDKDADRGEQVANTYGTTYQPSMEALLDDVEAVVICTENVYHKEAVLAAAAKGVHSLCEKPIATSVQDAEEMIEACEKAGVILQTAFPVRFNPPVQQLKGLIDSGGLGDIRAIHGTNRGTNPGGWFIDPALSGGGAVLDHTVHVVDLMRWFLQSEVAEVYAEVGSSFGTTTADDCGLLTFSFQNGTIATLDPSWSRNKQFPTWGDVTMDVIGSKGVTRLDAFKQNMLLFSDEGKAVQEQFWGDDHDNGLVQDFIESVQMNRPPSITGLDGLKAMQVGLAAYESFQKKQPVSIKH
ncbi:Gfo/Idh/MocA family oxidoreductase [Bacillaceae bacterium SIJ1]|uniref:Gfo/Idh/MocA family protein n=1 Tax=Litoribacterium kuwaitense TaxID=1398745 RepID=UPI0013EB3322|nr:Gfo/Idh/MocA family oxidoreductase [Litoribacterium kuwaitense]NGP44368.1 Gfo/Idh/MocA family oxidoreductase [Litoribacterium kuwaitense]